MNIRNRQRLFIIEDMICNSINVEYMNITQIFSGSLAEGLDLPGSDIDIMYALNYVDVIQNARNIKNSIQSTILVMETDPEHPGFNRLRLIAGGERNPSLVALDCFESTGQGLYLAVNGFVNNLRQHHPNNKFFEHGPCLSDKDQVIDRACCLRSKYLPRNAIPWIFRHRRKWPPNFVIDRIINYGCLLVPIGPKTVSENHLLWRLSFSVAEKLLVHSFNFTQFLCYGLLKLTLKRIVNTNNDVKDLLCSYFLKTALFWVSEEVDIETFQLSKLFSCFSLCLDKLLSWIQKCYCPNYFIPEHNMFLGKINQRNNKILLSVLDSIKCGGIGELTKNLFSIDIEKTRLLRTINETSFIMLDLFFYRTCKPIASPNNISTCLKVLAFTESLLKFESSTFINDVCKYRYAKISQCAAQTLPLPKTNSKTSNLIHKLYHRYLQDSIKADTISGWLLYASYYYVTGRYTVSLRLRNYFLSRYTPDIVIVAAPNCRKKCIENYKQNVHSSMTLNDKMKKATVCLVRYLEHSSLIPGELKLEVENNEINIKPIVMSFCLKFLCYHHLGDMLNRKQALHDLYLKVKDETVSNSLSESITILGVCYEISGDKDTALICYNEALLCDYEVCPSAQIRRSKLLNL